MLKHRLLIFFLLCSGFQALFFGQEKKDSLYTKIEEFSDKRKYTKFLHRFVFRREADSVSVPSSKNVNKEINYEGKTIRSIAIETIDPFGYTKTQRREDSKWYDRLAEKVHIETTHSTVKNYLMFKENEPFNSQKIYESERLLRTMAFVNRVDIRADENTSTRDSVDVKVKLLDSWSLQPRLNFSGSELGIGAAEENFMGWGHELEVIYTKNFSTHQNHLYGRYTANNLKGTYINATLMGERDFFNNENITLSATRGFFSPLTRWAGGFTFDFFKRHVALPTTEAATFPSMQIKVFRQDLWAGYQFPVLTGADGLISRNIAILGRFQNYQFKDNPETDENGFFRTSNSILVSALFTDRKYEVKRNVFRYELPEDIPYGKSFGVTAGSLIESNIAVPYAGMSASFGEFFKLGYYSLKAEYGRFFNADQPNRNEFKIEGSYFTPLQHWGFARVRHFFSPTYVLGNSYYNYSYQNRINLSAANEFPIFSGDYIGTQKLILRYQMQFFLNKHWKNFRFNPYLTTNIGWLSQNEKSLFSSPLQSKIGVGLLIYNPFLVFNRIQISFMYYPKTPFDNKPGYAFDQYRNDMFPIQQFDTDIPHFVNFP